MYNKKLIIVSLTLILCLNARAQFICGFENFPVDSSGTYPGNENLIGFEDNGLFFRNDYNPAFQSWNGFALSRKTDSITAGYGNQFSCRAGRAWEGATFALAYASSRVFIRRNPQEDLRRLKEFRYCNNTYAAQSMQNGDAFAKKFGGASGLDPDFFVLKVFNYFNGSISDSAAYYLADYRPDGTAADFIVKDWKLADAGFSNPFDSLGFELSSSDVGSFGMNTPAYFCLDNLITENLSPVKELNNKEIAVFPNPAKDHLWIQGAEGEKWQLFTLYGSLLLEGITNSRLARISLESLKNGNYILRTGRSRFFRVSIR